MRREDFIAWVAPAAQSVCAEYDLPWQCVVAQGALESGWGEKIIGQYNMFGRKWRMEGPYGNVPYIEKTTREYVDNQWITITTQFKDYASLEDAIGDWCWNITGREVYAPCLPYRHDLEAFVRALAPIYATDPDYADLVLSIINEGGF